MMRADAVSLLPVARRWCAARGARPAAGAARRRGAALVLAALLAVAGCASNELGCRTPVGDRSLTPAMAAASGVHQGARVTWGGTLVEARHREDRTELELIGYPLTNCGRPRLDEDAVGRFIVVHPGYLETAELAAGRALTASGRIIGTREGRIGGVPYRFPLLEDAAPRVWPRPGAAGAPARPVISIGVGAGSGGSGGGIGVRF